MGSLPNTSLLRRRGGVFRRTSESNGRAACGTVLRSAAWAWVVAFVGLLVGSAASPARSAETGDIDGDGRISIKDAIAAFADEPAAEGSLANIEAYACHPHWDFHDQIESGIIYLEALRRAVPDPLPHFFPVWDESAAVEPLAPDPRVEISWAPDSVRLTGTDRVRLKLVVENDVPIRAFSLLVESDSDALRVAPFFGNFSWPDDWYFLFSHALANVHATGDIGVGVGYAPFLITRGRYVINFGLETESRRIDVPILPGTHEIITEARLPRGLPAGEHGLRILETSEILLSDGTLVAPTLLGAPGEEGEEQFRLTQSVEDGFDGGVPPMDFADEGKSVLGDIEFRVTDAEEFPGNTFRVRVQMRTEVPLNHFGFRVTWPEGALLCTGERPEVLFENPEDTQPYAPYRNAFCSKGALGFGPRHEVEFALAGGKAGTRNYTDRPLEYFRPPRGVGRPHRARAADPRERRGGAEVPLSIRIPGANGVYRFGEGVPSYHPFGGTWSCFPPEFDVPNWTYQVTVHPGTVTVLGNQNPGEDPEPPDVGSRWQIGSSSARPSDVVSVPILTSLDDPPVSLLRLALEVDPAALEVEAIEVDVLELGSGEIVPYELARGEFVTIQECEEPLDPDTCTFGVPFFLRFHDTDERFVLFELTPSTPGHRHRRLPRRRSAGDRGGCAFAFERDSRARAQRSLTR